MISLLHVTTALHAPFKALFWTCWWACWASCLFVPACDSKPKPDPMPTAGPSAAASTPSSTVAAPPDPKVAKALELVIAYGSEKKTWFEEEAKAFEATSPKTPSGRPIMVVATAMGSGEAMNAITSGAVKPHVFSPASQAYVALLNNAYAAKTARTKPLAPPGEVIVLSPVVIAMWKPMAEALGWPGKPIGWADLLKVSADPKGWGSKGFPEWGRFKLGHTHPEFSNSGFLAVLAEAYAGAKKTRGLSAADLDAAGTRKLLESIEGTVVHYGKSTGFFAEKMLQRGPSYISAAVLYENLVIESYSAKTPPAQPLVAIYPKEGTFWSDHPYSILDADWVGPDERKAAEAFLAFLKGKPQQQRALELGFRPGDASIAITAPIDVAHGVDPKQPQTLLDVPDAAVLEKLLAVWREVKKGADVVFVFDKSGSMRGKPLDEAKRGAKSFFDNLTDADEATLLFFDSKVYPPVGPLKLGGGGRATLQQRLDGVNADGGTALYEAVGTAYALLQQRAAKNPMRTHAIVVMTDGNDESSKLTLPELKKQFPADEALVKVFTIAYGAEANPRALEEIAEAAKGSSVKGSVDTINQVYADMAAFF
jgi:Ca-activated chloride channel family protein